MRSTDIIGINHFPHLLGFVSTRFKFQTKRERQSATPETLKHMELPEISLQRRRS